MRRRNHSPGPHIIDDLTWFYDDRKGLQVIRDVRTAAGRFICTEMFIIPWRTARAALQRNELRPRGGEDLARKKPVKKATKKKSKRR